MGIEVVVECEVDEEERVEEDDDEDEESIDVELYTKVPVHMPVKVCTPENVTVPVQFPEVVEVVKGSKLYPETLKKLAIIIAVMPIARIRFFMYSLMKVS